MLNLKVVGMLRPHERLSTVGNRVFVDRPSMWQGMRRWLRGDHRRLNADVLDRVVGSALLLLTTCGDEQRRIRVAHELLRACAGLHNLQATYEQDTETVARLQMLIDCVRDRLASARSGDASRRLLQKALKDQTHID